MSVIAEARYYVSCPNCKDGEWRVDHLDIPQDVWWTCNNCLAQFHIHRAGRLEFVITPTGKRSTPVTVTLRSKTKPEITVKLNAWKYEHSQDDTPDEYFGHQKYFYEEHTCPTNWTSEIVQMECEGNTDPHGLFELIDIVDGHYKDPNDTTPDSQGSMN